MDKRAQVVTVGVAVVIVLFVVARLRPRRQSVPASPQPAFSALAARPAPLPVSASPSTADDACSESVVLNMRGHSENGLSVADMSVQDMNGKTIATETPPEQPAEYTTPCAKLDSQAPTSDASPQILRICKPRVFVLHIVGTQKGRFDLQVSASAGAAKPSGPVLLCNYNADADRIYDWVFRFDNRPQPIVFLLGSPDNPDVQRQVQQLAKP